MGMVKRNGPRGMEWGGRREEGSGWGTHVYLWRIHFDKKIKINVKVDSSTPSCLILKKKKKKKKKEMDPE